MKAAGPSGPLRMDDCTEHTKQTRVTDLTRQSDGRLWGWCVTALALSKKKLWVYLINIAFSALAMLHLTYLGSVFNSSVDYMEEDEDDVTHHTIQKWSELSWTSHWVTFGCWILYRLIL